MREDGRRTGTVTSWSERFETAMLILSQKRASTSRNQKSAHKSQTKDSGGERDSRVKHRKRRELDVVARRQTGRRLCIPRNATEDVFSRQL